MARPQLNSGSVDQINQRRSQLLLLLAEGKTLSQASQILNTPISTINDDNKYLKIQGLRFLGNMTKEDLSYVFHVSIARYNMVMNDCLTIAKDIENYNVKDRLRAYQLYINTNNIADNLYLNASKTFAWEELLLKVKQLNSIIDIDNINNSENNKISDILNSDMLIDKTIKIKHKVIESNNQLEDKSNKNKSKDKINSKGYSNYTKISNNESNNSSIKNNGNKIK